MNWLSDMKKKVIDGYAITKDEAVKLYHTPLDQLCDAANEIRYSFCGNYFDLCTIINGKSGNCSENCKYCAQSSFYHTFIGEYPLLDSEKIIEQAKYSEVQGIARFSIVTSGKKLSNYEVDSMCETICTIKQKTGLLICVSFGLLDEKQFRKLKAAGVSRVHNNIETSERNFPNVCTTHTFADKIAAIKAAQKAGLSVCSGGIMGLGESAQDRIDMALTLRSLGIQSVPINMLNPIQGTPYEKNKVCTIQQMRRIVAVFRFILPKAFIRLAGGRGLMNDRGKNCFLSGANAAISGDMLTTSGICTQTDMELLKDLGYTTIL